MNINGISVPNSGRGSTEFVSNTGRSSYLNLRRSKSVKRTNHKPSLPFEGVQEGASYADMFDNKEENDEDDEYIKVLIFLFYSS